MSGIGVAAASVMQLVVNRDQYFLKDSSRFNNNKKQTGLDKIRNMLTSARKVNIPNS